MFCQSLIHLIYGKPTKGLSKRTRHCTLWWEKAHPKRLTFRSMQTLQILPAVQSLNEEVYGSYALQYDPTRWMAKYSKDEDGNPMSSIRRANCAQCKQNVPLQNPRDFLWIPSGRAQSPSKFGYIFHPNCFRCAECKYRFYSNLFASKNGRYVCVHCLRGVDVARPIRRWHLSMVSQGRDDSRNTGEIFPRSPNDEEWLFDPDT